MTIRTTRDIIVEEIDFDGNGSISSIEFSKSFEECKSLQQEWVLVSDLKREIENIKLHLASEYRLGSKNHKLCCYALNVLKKSIDLCKSSEQGCIQDDKSCSVSGEQTGEDKRYGKKCTSKSSPVQNPKKCTCSTKCEVCKGLGNIEYCCRCGGAL